MVQRRAVHRMCDWLERVVYDYIRKSDLVMVGTGETTTVSQTCQLNWGWEYETEIWHLEKC